MFTLEAIKYLFQSSTLALRLFLNSIFLSNTGYPEEKKISHQILAKFFKI